MIKPVIIGNKKFKSKKDALTHYKAILNSYKFGQSLSEDHFNDLIDLLNISYSNDDAINPQEIDAISSPENNFEEDTDDEVYVEDIQVSRVQFNTKCFEIFYTDGTSSIISYILYINQSRSDPVNIFRKACRNSIYDDIRKVKQNYFDENSVKGLVKCQETGILSKWTELTVDHRQPHTFSVIVDRFIEVHNINPENIEYISDEDNKIQFNDKNIKESFKTYHQEKAFLRIVKKECNMSRSGLARLKSSKKDLRINNNT